MSFDTKINKWIKALGNADEIFRRAIIENQAEILDLNVAQLEVGKDSLGNLLDEYTTDEYAQFKQAIGSKAPFKIADLKLTGDFHSGFVLKYEGATVFNIDSTDEKTEQLKKEWGENIFGLSEESLEQIRPAILESFLIMFRNELL